MCGTLSRGDPVVYASFVVDWRRRFPIRRLLKAIFRVGKVGKERHSHKPDQLGASWYHASEAIQALKGPFQTSKRCKRWQQPLKFTF
ncbi:unnamed protein product [Sphagnum tenellum]